MKLKLVSALFALLFVASGCGSSGEVTVSDLWARPPAPGQTNGVLYGTITNDTGDAVTFIGASVGDVARTELHESTMTDGVMSMQARPDGFVIEAGESLVLEPGGPHVMLREASSDDFPTDDLAATFTFGSGDEVVGVAAVETLTLDADDADHDMSEMDDMDEMDDMSEMDEMSDMDEMEDMEEAAMGDEEPEVAGDDQDDPAGAADEMAMSAEEMAADDADFIAEAGFAPAADIELVVDGFLDGAPLVDLVAELDAGTLDVERQRGIITAYWFEFAKISSSWGPQATGHLSDADAALLAGDAAAAAAAVRAAHDAVPGQPDPGW